MKREEVRKIIPEITDEQMNKLMDIHSTNIGNAKKDYETVKADLEKAKSDNEKYQNRIKELEESLNNGEDFKKKFEELEKEIANEKYLYRRNFLEFKKFSIEF